MVERTWLRSVFGLVTLAYTSRHIVITQELMYLGFMVGSPSTFEERGQECSRTGSHSSRETRAPRVSDDSLWVGGFNP